MAISLLQLSIEMALAPVLVLLPRAVSEGTVTGWTGQTYSTQSSSNDLFGC